MRGWILPLLAVTALAAEPMGVTHRDGTTTFRVWAPNAKSVEVIGDFNAWRASANDRLAPDPESPGVWALKSKRGLPKGAYQFLLNGQLRRRDPYARAVTPDGLKSLFYDPYAFAWEGDRAPVYPLEDLVIYEMHIGAFHDPKPQDGMPGTFYDAIKRLDHLVSLGINVVEILPIHEFAGSHSWGYNPSDLFAVEQAYGGPDGLKAFVKACHARGLVVHLDIVHNHYGPENLDLKNFDGSDLYFYTGPGIGMTPWGPRVKFDDPMVRRFVRDNAMMWLTEYRADGFRWDSTINIRAYDQGATPLPAGLRMLEDINAEIRSAFPTRISIAEDSLDQGGFHASWDYDFHHNVMPVLKKTNDTERDMNLLVAALTAHPSSMGRVIYVDNHDEAGKINGQVRIANDVDPRNPSGEYARKLSALGAALTLTAPGTPLLFMGNEFQQTGTFHEDQWLEWGHASRRTDLVQLHRDLIRLRRNLDGSGNALKGRGVDPVLVDNDRKVLAFWRWHEQTPEDRMVIVMNFGGRRADGVIVPFPSAGPWSLKFHSDAPTYGGKSNSDEPPFTLGGPDLRAQLNLAPYSTRIYVRSEAKDAARAQTAAPVKELPKPVKPPFSMYASIHVLGAFNQSNRAAGALSLKQDYLWEGRITFTNVPDADFRLSANEDGKIYWGAGFDSTIRPGFHGPLKRLGPNVKLLGPLDGPFLVRFNEDSLELQISPADPEPVFREWRDQRGARIEARLVRAEGDAITLERRDGRTIQVSRAQLSREDQDFLTSSPR